MKTVSVCVVAYNEEKFLPGVLRDIEMQTYPADHIEVVLIDSGSLDHTRSLMENFCKKNKDRFLNIQVLDNPGRIQSCGWNEAIVHFTSDVMIRVDAHSHMPPEFVQKNMENLAQGELVSGGIRPTLTEGEDAFSRTLLLAENSMFGSSVSTARRGGKKTYVKSFFHGAYDRKVLETAGGFREDLGRTEDNEFHHRIRQHGYQLAMSPDIVSYQYIRPTLWKMGKQKFGNGYWIGLTAGVCPGCLSVYHFVPFAFVGGILLTTILSILGYPLLGVIMWSMYGVLAVVMTLLAVAGETKKHGIMISLPLMFLYLHVLYGAGTWIGLLRMPFWRKKHKECPSVDRVKEKMLHESDLS